MKKTVFLLTLFISTITQAQTVPKQSRLAITQNVKQNNATRIVVQDSITKELNWVLKSNLNPTLDNVLGAGNTSARSFTAHSITLANAQTPLVFTRIQASANFGLGNPGISQPFGINSTNYFGTSYVAGSSEISGSAVAEHSFNVGNSIGDGITSGIFRISRTRVQSTVPIKYATDLSNSYDARSLVDKSYVDTAISGIPGSSTPTLQQVLVAGKDATLPITINLSEQPYTDIPYGALSVSTAGYLDVNSGLQTGIAIQATAPNTAIQAYSTGIEGQGIGVDAQGNILGGNFYSNEGSGIFSYGEQIGVQSSSPNVGISAYGDNVGVQANGVSIGVQATGGNIGVSGTGTNNGVYASGETGVVAEGFDTGLYASGNIGVNVNGDNIGVSATGTNNGVYASGETGVVAEGFDTGLYANGESAGVEASGGATGIVATGNYGITTTGQNTGIASTGQLRGGDFSSPATAIYANGDNLGAEIFGSIIGLKVQSLSGDGAIVDILPTNTSNIASFKKNGINQVSISHDGKLKANQFLLNASNTAPASSTATGTLGEIRITASYIYYCTATNTWVRSALTTW